MRLLLLALLASPAAADLPTLLSQIEGLPSAEAFAAAAPKDPVAALIGLRDAEDTPFWMRQRALDALARFPEPRTRALFEDLLGSGWRPSAPAVVHRALACFTRAFPEEAWIMLRAHLEHPDPRVRRTAIYLLAEVGDPGPLRGLQAGEQVHRGAGVLR